MPTLPLAIPSVVLALVFLILHTRFGIAGSKAAQVAGHTVMTLPFVLRLVRANFAGYAWSVERAAANLGASPAQAFRHVTLPLVRRGVVGGAIFAFVLSFDEVVIALFLPDPDAVTLPVRIFTYLDQSPSPIVLAAGSRAGDLRRGDLAGAGAPGAHRPRFRRPGGLSRAAAGGRDHPRDPCRRCLRPHGAGGPADAGHGYQRGGQPDAAGAEPCPVGVRRFVHYSSWATIGPYEGALPADDAPMRPDSPYGTSKAAADEVLRGPHGRVPMELCALRLTSV